MDFKRLGCGIGVALAAGVGGCGLIDAQEHPLQYGGLGQPAALANAVEKGCMPFALGERGEVSAMAYAGLHRQPKRLSWPSPGVTEPQYSAGAGNPVVTINGVGCTVRTRGEDGKAFEAVLDAVYRRKFGDSYTESVPPPQTTDSMFPGMKRFCAAGHVFQSYPDPPGKAGDRGFNVMISPGGRDICPPALAGRS